MSVIPRMDTVDRHPARTQMGAHTRLPTAATAVLGAAACAALALAWTLYQPGDRHAPAAPAPATDHAAPRTHVAGVPLSAASPPQAQPRRVYRYSVVPGGVTNREELAHAVAADKVVATHYEGIAVAAVRTIVVDKPRAVHVSYRKGDQIYWTAKTVMLAAGETLLTDGHNLVRTRCGNRISDTPRQPVEGGGPSEQDLDAYTEGQGGDATAANLSMDDADLPGGVAGVTSGATGTGTAQAAAAGRTRAARTLAEDNAFQRLASIPTYSAGTLSGGTEGTSAASRSTQTGQTGSGGSGGVTTGTGTPSGTTPAPAAAAANPDTTPGSDPGASATPGTDTGTGMPALTQDTPNNIAPQLLSSNPGAATPGTDTQQPTSGGATPGTSNPTSPTSPTLLANDGTPYVPTVPDDTPKDTPPGLPSDPHLAPDPADAPIKRGADTQAAATSADVPEPGTPWLGAAGLAAVLLVRRRPRGRR